MVTCFLKYFAVVYGGLRVSLVPFTCFFWSAHWSRTFLSASLLFMAASEYLWSFLLIPSEVLNGHAFS